MHHGKRENGETGWQISKYDIKICFVYITYDQKTPFE